MEAKWWATWTKIPNMAEPLWDGVMMIAYCHPLPGDFLFWVGAEGHEERERAELSAAQQAVGKERGLGTFSEF